MKSLLLFCLLGFFAGPLAAQNWKSPLPVDSSSGYIVYRGRMDAPGQTPVQSAARAIRFARTELKSTPSGLLVDSSKVSQLSISGSAERRLLWHGGIQGSAGRILRYEVVIRPKAGYYEYEISDLVNETPAVHVQSVAGIVTSTAPKTSAVEAIIRNSTSYDKKHRPTAAFKSYCEAVDNSIQTVIADLRRALVPN